MSQIRNTGSHGLQQLIDSYNEEIMRYSRLASPETDAESETFRQSAEKELAERQREEGEFEAERGVTEQSYWLGKGKYGMIRETAEESRSVSSAEMTARKGEPAPPNDIETPDNKHRIDNPPQKQWLADLEQGLLELKRGLAELAEGQRELREGQLAYLNGIAERDCRLGQKNGQTHENASGNVSDEDYYQSGGFIPSAGAAHGSDSFPTPSGAVPIDPPDTPPAQSPYSVPSDGTGFGQLQAAVYTARRSVPIPGALVTVFSGGAPYASYTTDIDGKTPVIQLPAGISSSPDDSYASPFTNYRVIATADGYYPQNDLTAQIFSGQTALLPVEMVPLPDGI